MQVRDNPIIPYLKGAGTAARYPIYGLASQRVLMAQVENAYGGSGNAWL